MLYARTRKRALAAPALLLLAALALPPAALAQTARKPAPAPAPQADDAPPFREYKGVHIGMSAEEARKLLGTPTDKDDKQEVFAFGEQESCQVYYDGAKKVSAFYVTFSGSKPAPTAKAVLGEEPEAKQDGSVHKRVTFPKAGYWVSYTRTSGDAPMTIIVLQKMEP